MAQQVLLRAQGLYTFPHHLSAVPSGGLIKALNVVINRDSIAESRRGFKIYGDNTGVDVTKTVKQLINYKLRLLRHYGSILQWDDGNGSFTSFSQSVSEVDSGLRIKSVEQNGNLYFTTSQGIKKISISDSSQFSTASIDQAGGIKALDVSLALTTNTGWFDNNSIVAYRVVWGIKDSNSNLILGAPSQREIIENVTGATKTVNVTITIPSEVTTAHFYQVYRSAMSTSPEDPGDELQLVQEGNPTSAEISTGSLTYEDVQPDTLRELGANLYTNQNSGEGILQANDRPPLAKDVASFKNYTFFANTKTRHRFNLTLLSISSLVPGTSKLTITDGTTTHTYTFKTTSLSCATHTNTTIDGFSSTSALSVGMSLSGSGIPDDTYIVSIDSGTQITISQAATNSTTTSRVFATESVTNKQIAISQLSTPSEQIDETSRSLVRIINKQSSELVSAYYISGPSDLPGQILLEAKNLNQDTIYLLCNNSAAGGEFNPDLSPSKTITANTMANPTVVSCTSHGLLTGNEIVISGSNSTPSIDGIYTITKIDADTFSIPVNVTVAGTAGAWKLVSDAESSDDEISPNRIYYSKVQQPDAVPLLNYIDVGPKDKAILRILGLRDSLFILKEDGVYRLSGLVAPFQVYPFDFSVNTKAPDSAVILNNLIYVFTSQGVSTISDNTVSVISRPIEDQITKLITYDNFIPSTFGIAYETDRSYYLFTLTSSSDDVSTQCFKYNTFTNAWTILDLGKQSGIVNSADDKLYLAATDTNYLEQERKSFDRTDFADREYVLALGSNAIDDTAIFLPTAQNVSVGDVFTQTQYLTIYKINQLLQKLDNDGLLADDDYLDSLEASAGNYLSDVLDSIISKIAADTGRLANTSTIVTDYTDLIGTGAASFSDLQDAFNNLIDVLNDDEGVSFNNYNHSNNTVTYEFIVESVDTATNIIHSPIPYPIIEGDATIYNHINVELQWVPQFFNDVSMSKHVSEGTLIFEDSAITKAILSYSTDLSGSKDEQEIVGNGNGIFGNMTFGEGVFGGNGSAVSFRTYIPKEKQRCRYINIGFAHKIAREVFSLYGYSVTYNPMSQRAWR